MLLVPIWNLEIKSFLLNFSTYCQETPQVPKVFPEGYLYPWQVIHFYQFHLLKYSIFKRAFPSSWQVHLLWWIIWHDTHGFLWMIGVRLIFNHFLNRIFSIFISIFPGRVLHLSFWVIFPFIGFFILVGRFYWSSLLEINPVLLTTVPCFILFVSGGLFLLGGTEHFHVIVLPRVEIFYRFETAWIMRVIFGISLSRQSLSKGLLFFVREDVLKSWTLHL